MRRIIHKLSLEIFNFIIKLNPYLLVSDFERRSQLGKVIHEKFQGRVISGLFRGALLPKENSWSRGSDTASKILGLYEQEVLQIFEELSFKFEDLVLIDLGAADGYYAWGGLSSGVFSNAIIFEQNEQLRGLAAEFAEANQVRERLRIFGEVSEESFSQFLVDCDLTSSNYIVISDLEGFEFQLFNNDILNLLSCCHLIIECHDFSEHQNKLNSLLERVGNTHKVKRLFATHRSFPNPDTEMFAELDYINSLPDDVRWRIVSEGRPSLMSWIVATPHCKSYK